jgi:hypothetical protein
MAIVGIATGARLHDRHPGQPFDYGAPKLVEPELYLMFRAHELVSEILAVRPQALNSLQPTTDRGKST